MSVALDELAILPASQQAYKIYYEDDVLLVVEKPYQLLTVPGRHPANRDCLISRVQRTFPSAQVVHRLDYDTSGLVVLPLNKPALSALSKQFQARTIEKEYLAIVHGELPLAGEINLPIAADETNRPLYKVCQQTGKPSLTVYQRLNYDPATHTSRVLLQPVTGRSHQLRLHLAALGHPIVGDVFYGNTAISVGSRLMLHAWQISLQHPVTQQRIKVEVLPSF
ncbi:RluA family pseudouridine synthase [Alishewanella tabrizica]|uniref:Ribosomal large subunit pseudouridine synthase A n=1 Tax=Alishewanella tabrizica TaxID=671278 RepID=A0ABQ2WL70_9ALTE|nr:RluA family pseudouridine synthase [Alishewanella tabrizica]GGW62227.1 ribosomal large subunit pseudouridine synthase A [Alishewanella tabrizica]